MDERERYWRRVKGMLMLQTGVPQAEVARRLGVTRAAVSGWKGRLAGGETPTRFLSIAAGSLVSATKTAGCCASCCSGRVKADDA